ncbi:MAG TPA: GNAT family N-acetyltransferase [Candidatus Deferrimicrobium sp.]|nr:GNAT family N-acetyltransferase [Candidatus Deferrimicrobium sp.]
MVIIRDYKENDLEATTKLMKILSEELNFEFNEKNWPQQTKIRNLNPEFRTFVAEQDGEVIGMCFSDIQRDQTGLIHGLIRNVIISPQNRHKGIASELISKAMDNFYNLKVDTIRVLFNEGIKDVINLFEQFNFKRSHIILERDVVKVRDYKEKDYEDTKELMKIYSKLINQPFVENEWKQTVKLCVRNPQSRILISEKDGLVTGMAFLTIASDETGLTIGYIDNIIIHPKYRRLEYGKSLLIRAIETLNVLNVDKVRIMAHLEVTKWLQYFEDVGFHKLASLMELKVKPS